MFKMVSYNNLQIFFENTLNLSLNSDLELGSNYFERILTFLKDVLRNENVNSVHKNLIAKQLENILLKIPPKHKV